MRDLGNLTSLSDQASLLAAAIRRRKTDNPSSIRAAMGQDTDQCIESIDDLISDIKNATEEGWNLLDRTRGSGDVTEEVMDEASLYEKKAIADAEMVAMMESEGDDEGAPMSEASRYEKLAINASRVRQPPWVKEIKADQETLQFNKNRKREVKQCAAREKRQNELRCLPIVETVNEGDEDIEEVDVSAMFENTYGPNVLTPNEEMRLVLHRGDEAGRACAAEAEARDMAEAMYSGTFEDIDQIPEETSIGTIEPMPEETSIGTSIGTIEPMPEEASIGTIEPMPEDTPGDSQMNEVACFVSLPRRIPGQSYTYGTRLRRGPRSYSQPRTAYLQRLQQMAQECNLHLNNNSI